MAVALRASFPSQNSTATTVVMFLTVGGGQVFAGDIWILTATFRAGSTVTISNVPSTFNLINRIDSGSGTTVCTTVSYWYLCTGSETGGGTNLGAINISAASKYIVFTDAYSGCNTTSPILAGSLVTGLTNLGISPNAYNPGQLAYGVIGTQGTSFAGYAVSGVNGTQNGASGTSGGSAATNVEGGTLTSTASPPSNWSGNASATTYAHQSFTLDVPPEDSPALELSNFGTFPDVPAGAAINLVTAQVNQYGTSAAMGAPTYQLWNGTTAQIGATQTGADTTSPSNVDTLVFNPLVPNGITYSQLATLRLRVYAHGPAGSTLNVDAASLQANYTYTGPPPTSGTGAITFGGSGSATVTVNGTGTGAIVFAGTGTATFTVAPPVAGYTAWWDASQITGQADNTLLATWPDSSGSGHDFTQATDANKPVYYSSTPGKTINGKPAVWFNSPTYMQVPPWTQAQPFTICAVAQSSAVGTQALITDAATDWFFYAGSSIWVLYAASYITFQAFDSALHAVQGVFNGASSSLTVDSSTMAASATIGSNPFGASGLLLGTLSGPTDWWIGPICEVIIYPTALTAPQITSIYNYLRAKWFGVSGSGAISFGGSGTATVQVSTTGTGAIVFAGAGIAGVTVTPTGTGAITFGGAGAATLTVKPTGTGAITFAGAGTATVQVSTTGTGAIVFAGSGAATYAVLVTATGTGAIVFGGSGTATYFISATGTGAIAFGGSGTGRITVNGTGTGALAFGGSGVATSYLVGTGSGAITFGGSGTATVTVNGVGSGALAFGGTGTATYGNMVPASGTGAITFAGSGSPVVTVTVTGTGAITFAGSGTAVVTVNPIGTGAITFGGTGTGKITVNPTGTGAIVFAGSGVASFFVPATGTGAIVFGGAGTAKVTVSTSGTGAIVFGGSGTAAYGNIVPASGTGAITFAGAGTAQVVIIGTGSGAISFAGTGTAKVVLSPTGTGAITFGGAGTGSLTVTTTGSGAIIFGGAGAALVTVRTTGTGAIVFAGAGVASSAILVTAAFAAVAQSSMFVSATVITPLPPDIIPPPVYRPPVNPPFLVGVTPIAMNPSDAFGGWTAVDEVLYDQMRPEVRGVTSGEEP